MFRHLTPHHMKAARALLDWNQNDLAEKADMAPSSIRRFETKGLAKASLENVDKLVSAFENAGIEFYNGGQPGVRLIGKGD